MDTCDNCDGEGGWEVVHSHQGEDASKWVPCPACGGSGWVPGEPPQLEMDEGFEPVEGE